MALSPLLGVSAWAQTPQAFRIHGWQPATSALVTRKGAGHADETVQRAQTAKASQQLCLTGTAPTQTLVQVQPAEGGEARYLVLGGKKPGCQAIGQGWLMAVSGEAPWYKNLFAMLEPKQGSVRISASTAGTTRGLNTPAHGEAPPRIDPCGLYPTAHQGAVNLPSGTTALTLGTNLPEGTSAALRPTGPNKEQTPRQFTANVHQGQLKWPNIEFHAGEQWRIVVQPKATVSGAEIAPKECSASIAVMPQSANPLNTLRANSPAFDTIESSQQATLVAAQLEDPSLLAWHAWLLSAIAPAQSTPADDLGALLWKAWWQQPASAAPIEQPK